MPRPEKVQAVEEISQRFEEAEAVFVTEYRGLSVAQQQALRGELRKAGASYKVLKMSLTRRALEGRPEEGLTEWMVGPTAVAFVDGDPVPTAKVLTDFATENEALVIKAGTLAGQILSPETVSKLAKIEAREVLLAKIAGAAKAPMSKFAGMLASFTRDAASMLSQLLEKKEAEGPAEEVGDDPAAQTAPAEVPEEAAEVPEDATASDEAPSNEADGASDDAPETDSSTNDDEGDGAPADAEEE